MNALPSMIVLDFCEWLKNRATQQHSENYTDIFDLILNDEYRGNLRRLAKEYLQNGDNSMRGLLHHFIDSEEFDRCCNKYCNSFFFEEWNHYKSHPEELRHFLHHCYPCPEVDRAFKRFIRRYYDENVNGFTYDG